MMAAVDIFRTLESELNMLAERMRITASTYEIRTRQEQMEIVDETMKIMEERGKLMFKKIRDMKHVRNALSPISKLSVECLQEIFYFISSSGDSDEYYQHDRRITWDWTVITIVCQHWRETALQYPKLWSRINPSWNINRVQIYLERSRKADLYVMVESPPLSMQTTRSFSEFYQKISVDWYRIRGFGILTPIQSEDWVHLQDIFDTGSLTGLRRLQLKSYEYHSLLNTSSAFLRRCSLFHLSLTAISIPWNLHLLRGLKELVLDDVMDAEQPTVSELLDILEGCPELTLLDLCDSGPRFSEHNIRASRSIALPHLRSISLYALDFRNCEEIFSSLSLPLKTSIDIGCFRYPFHNPIPFPVSQLDMPVQRKKARILIKDHEIGFSTSEDKDDCQFPRVQLHLHFHSEYDDTHLMSDVFRSIQPIFSQKSWGNITTLDLDFQERPSPESYIGNKFDMLRSSWASLFDQLYAIQNMKLLFKQSYSTSFKFTEDFVMTFTDSSNSSPFNFKCPNLQTLEFVEASFSDKEVDSDDWVDYYRVLLDHLSLRCLSSGKKLHRLSFIRCVKISEYDDQHDATQPLDFCDIFHWEE